MTLVALAILAVAAAPAGFAGGKLFQLGGELALFSGFGSALRLTTTAPACAP